MDAIEQHIESLLEDDPVECGAYFATHDCYSTTSYASELGILALAILGVVNFCTRAFRSNPQAKLFPDHSGLLFVATSDSRIYVFAIEQRLLKRQLGKKLLDEPKSSSTKMSFVQNTRTQVRLSVSPTVEFELTTNDSPDRIQQLIDAI